VGFLEDKLHLQEVEVSLVGKVMLSNHLCKKHKHQGVYSEVVDKLILLVDFHSISSKMLDNLKVEDFLEEIIKFKQQAKLKVEVYLVDKIPQLLLLVVAFSDKILQLKPEAYSGARPDRQLPQSEVNNKRNNLVYLVNNNHKWEVSYKITKINWVPVCPLEVSFSNMGNHH
jgi:hypothetical protein